MFSKKKDSSYHCVHLNKNRSPIKYSTLFDTGAETHITRSIEEFNASIYTLASLPSINTASREAKPLGSSKRTIICTTDNRDTYTLNLSKVQYLPGYSITIFRVRKLLDRGDI